MAEAEKFLGYRCFLNRSVRIEGRTVKKGDAVLVCDSPVGKDEKKIILLADREIRGVISNSDLKIGDIREEPWFFQELPPNVATTLLEAMTPGSFIVRSFKKRLSFSIRSTGDSVRNIWIHQGQDGQCYLVQEECFSHLQEMVLHYSKHCGLDVLITQYPKKENLEKLWILDPSELTLKDVSMDYPLPFTTKTGTYADQPISALVSKFKQSKHEIQILRQEARMLMSLEHDNIVKLVGVHITSSCFALVTEQCSGGSLSNFLRANGDTLAHNWECLVQAGNQIASTSLFLHRKGIVHNEMILENWHLVPSPFTLKLTSFHYSKFEGSRANPILEDLFLRFCRVPIFPPEVTTRGQSICQSDLWAVGLLLWRLFHLGAPLDRNSDLLSTTKTSPWPVNLPPDLAEVVDNIIQGCLHEVPQLRMSAYELSKQFRGLLELHELMKRRGSNTRTPVEVLFENKIMSQGGGLDGNKGVNTPNLTGSQKKKKFSFFRRRKSLKKSEHARTTSSIEVNDKQEIQSSGLLQGLYRGSGNRPNSAGPLGRHSSGLSLYPSSAVSYSSYQYPSQSSLSTEASVKFLGSPRSSSYAPLSVRSFGCRFSPDLPSNMSATNGETLSIDGQSPSVSLQGDESLTHRFEQLVQMTKSLKKILRQEKAEKASLGEEVRKLRAELQRQTTDLQSKIDNLEDKLIESETERRHLSKTKTLIEKSYEGRIVELNSRIHELVIEIDKLSVFEKPGHTFDEEEGKITDDISKLKEEDDRLKRQAVLMQEENNILTTRCRSLQTELHRLRSQVKVCTTSNVATNTEDSVSPRHIQQSLQPNCSCLQTTLQNGAHNSAFKPVNGPNIVGGHDNGRQDLEESHQEDNRKRPLPPPPPPPHRSPTSPSRTAPQSPSITKPALPPRTVSRTLKVQDAKTLNVNQSDAAHHAFKPIQSNTVLLKTEAGASKTEGNKGMATLV